MVGMGQKDAYVGGSVSFGSAKPAVSASAPSSSAPQQPSATPLKPLPVSSTVTSSTSNSNIPVNTAALDALLFSQSTSGAWTKVKIPELSTTFGLKAEDIVAACPAIDEVCSVSLQLTLKNALECWLTALVLVYLQLKFSSVKDEWELIATKGEHFLNQNAKTGYCTLAQEFFKNKGV